MKAVILAAGRGTRMGAEKAGMPKVMFEALGRPLLAYVLDALAFVPPRDTTIVAGFGKELVISAFGGSYSFAVQDKQLGTGHAVMSARRALEGYDGPVLVAAGDMPLLTEDTYRGLVGLHLESGNKCTILSSMCESPEGYGRIVRDSSGNFVKIVEHRDCSEDELDIREINSSVYVFETKSLLAALDRLECSNAQGEYYLTDVPAMIHSDGGPAGVFVCRDWRETLGVNTPEQLRVVEDLLRARN